MNSIKSKTVKLKAKRTFLKKGTCSRTFFYLLNREFGHPKEMEERAIDPLAGGIIQQGYQCGMVWGATMAVGAESFRRSDDPDQSIRKTINATQRIVESFKSRAKSIECEDISKTDFTNKWSLAKHFLTGKFYTCFYITGKWAPEAIKAAREGLMLEQNGSPQKALSCASEVVKKMGGNEEEMAMVAGFAGGLGLSGSGCGALSAAIWKTTLELVRKENWKPSFSDPNLEKIIEKFYGATDYKIECKEICGKLFQTIDEHTEFIKNGGCENIIHVLTSPDHP